MQIYTIGFTRKSAETFFSILAENQVTCLVDIRVHPSGQLAGFTKQADLRYFLRRLNGCDYRHLPQLTPSEGMLKAYHAHPDWQAYEVEFNRLMDERGVPEILDRTLFEDYTCCLLCSEPTPERCHRRLVAGRLAAAWGAQIAHL